jgi:hypothetical protein
MAATDNADMPKDRASYPIPALAPEETTHVQVTVSGTSAEIPLTVSTAVYELNTSVDSHIRVGLASQGAATTADRYLPAGSYVYAKLSEHEEIVIIKAASVSGSGVASMVKLR